MSLFKSSDLAVDIGTATIRVAGGADGVSRHPAVFRTSRALDRGVIVNLDATIGVLRPMIRKRRRMTAGRMRVLACAPTDVSSLERNLIRSSVLEAGASSVVIVPEPLAAAVGAGINIGSQYAKLLVDFGEGVTDCAIIRDGRIIESLANRVGCGDLRRAVQTFAAAEHGMEIDDAGAERLLRRAMMGKEEDILFFHHESSKTSVPPVPMAGLHAELQPILAKMLSPIRSLLGRIPAVTGAEVIEDGIFLTGGGALLPGIREAVMRDTGIETRVVQDPLAAVIEGARAMLPMTSTLDLWTAWGSHQRPAQDLLQTSPEAS